VLDAVRRRWPLLLTVGQAVYAYAGRHRLPEAGFWVLVTLLLAIVYEVRDLRLALQPDPEEKP